ncbi:N12 class adenine-specific DNA methylase [Cryobacterium sp. CAN_C3]|uniref:hypothetical protein n=1 Tax=unclassified Cryobacterium TaxID=2649013 RepID=UPI0018C8DAA2|nr:hypothetical protein [Cryobacterium sp. CAN_C3]MEC5154880.1 N12 class adenine-specific DNA methylase [Cryobacterium sp. CAN_C3]
MKLEYLRSQHGDCVVTVATATPLAHSITEAYVMQRYLGLTCWKTRASVTSMRGQRHSGRR